ncbi:DUF4139 domain-containing protein [Pseudophaeobacter leonis]|uniref:DUF4139 domain-containing protein n=1 Tax=Pseudophaeobacter leonis TaxID=1144477 RepID=UPI0009F6FE53|nr:DUF4139 domain-containing protein [Pseudophaeobacter leonis]
MRFSLSLFSLLASSVASFAWGGDIAVTSRVAEVPVFPQLAEITRRADLDLPLGQHRLILSNIPKTADLETLQIDLTGADQTALLFRYDGVPPRTANDPELLAAEAVIKEIEARIQSVYDASGQARSAASAAETAIGFLEQLGSNEGLADAGADALRQITRMISQEADAAGKQALAAQIRARNIEAELEALQDELQAAVQALAAISREDSDRLYLVVEVDVPEAGAGQLELRYFTKGEVYSEPSYAWHLTTGGMAKVSLQRGFGVSQNTGENWEAVDLTISTLEPGEQGAPSYLPPLLRRVGTPRPDPWQRLLSQSDFAASEAPMVEAVVMEDARAGASWGADTSGPGVSYHFSHPVSIASGADILRLDMDRLTTEAKVLAVAVPARDETAYRVAEISNTFGEDLLAADWVPHFMDGKLVTFAAFAGLAAGQEAALGFGAIRGLRLARDVLQKSDGERGVISRSNQREEAVEISAVNLTAETWPLRLLDRVPYSQQEELEIDWVAAPRPAHENVDKQRGILAWEFDLAPGEDRLIRLETTLSWPEGKQLR